jgi:hypothetical protein
MPESSTAKIDGSTEEGKRQIQVKRMNDLAISCFTMAFTKEIMMKMVSKAKIK